MRVAVLPKAVVLVWKVWSCPGSVQCWLFQVPKVHYPQIQAGRLSIPQGREFPNGMMQPYESQDILGLLDGRGGFSCPWGLQSHRGHWQRSALGLAGALAAESMHQDQAALPAQGLALCLPCVTAWGGLCPGQLQKLPPWRVHSNNAPGAGGTV